MRKLFDIARAEFSAGPISFSIQVAGGISLCYGVLKGTWELFSSSGDEATTTLITNSPLGATVAVTIFTFLAFCVMQATLSALVIRAQIAIEQPKSSFPPVSNILVSIIGGACAVVISLWFVRAAFDHKPVAFSIFVAAVAIALLFNVYCAQKYYSEHEHGRLARAGLDPNEKYLPAVRIHRSTTVVAFAASALVCFFLVLQWIG